MTIVLQHRFWDLIVSEDRFEVKLTFDGIPERLVVPFAAIKVFFDPSVRYGLQFEDPDGEGDGLTVASRPGLTAVDARAPRVPRKPKAAKKSRTERKTGDGSAAPIAETPASRAGGAGAPALAALENAPRATSEGQIAVLKAVEDKSPAAPGSGAQIVSLDQFRKK